MRVIAGKFRNLSLRGGDNFRPTSDRVRETLFNILQTEIEGSVFVDAFAGSGAVGIEALSRGASKTYFIENNRKALVVLESNLLLCCEGEKWRIFSLPAIKALQLIQQEEPSPDFLFFDPPYDYDQYSELLAESNMRFPAASHILETSTRTALKIPSGLTVTKTRAIGETQLLFLRSVVL
jgi:16S rRNA (guanine966-N2)-methyltransferase